MAFYCNDYILPDYNSAAVIIYNCSIELADHAVSFKRTIRIVVLANELTGTLFL